MRCYFLWKKYYAPKFKSALQFNINCVVLIYMSEYAVLWPSVTTVSCEGFSEADQSRCGLFVAVVGWWVDRLFVCWWRDSVTVTFFILLWHFRSIDNNMGRSRTRSKSPKRRHKNKHTRKRSKSRDRSSHSKHREKSRERNAKLRWVLIFSLKCINYSDQFFVVQVYCH